MKHYWLPLLIILFAIISLFFIISTASASVCYISNGCTSTSTSPSYGQMLIGGKNGEYELVASSTFGGVNSVFGRSGAVTAQSGDYTTSLITEGSNLYYTAARSLADFIANLAATSSVKSITTLPSLSLPYSQLTGTPSSLPTSTLLADSNTFSGSNKFNNAPVLGSLTGFIKAASGVLSTALISLTSDITGTLGVGNGGTGSTTLSGILKGNGTGQVQTAIPGNDYLAPSSLSAGSGISYSNGVITNTIGYPFPANATGTTITFGNGFVSQASSTIVGNATTTGMEGVGSLFLNGQRFTNLLGSGLSNSAGALTVSGLTTGNLASANVSQFTNDAGYITSAGSGAPYSFQGTNNSTSTTVGFTGGLYSSASSTFSGPFHLNLSNGGLGINNGLVYSGATTTAGTGLQYSNGQFNVTGLTTSQFTSANVSQWTNDAGYLTSAGQAPFPNNATSSTLSFSNGLVSNGSTTVAGLASGLVGNNNGKLYGFASSSLFGFTPQAAGTYLTSLGNYATTTGTAISISTSTVTANGLTYGNTIAVSPNGILVTPTVTGTYNGQAGSVANAVTFNNSGAGASSGQTYNGSSAQTISYNTIGAQVAGNYDTFAYPFLSNATTTILTFSNGLVTTASTTLNASTTITGQLTLNGATTTASNGVNLTAGCFAIGGACITNTNLLPLNNTWTGLNTFGTTTAAAINGVVVVDGVRFAQTGVGVQNAINTACNGIVQGSVFVPVGTYNTSATITTPSYCEVWGVKYGTIFQKTGSDFNYVFQNSNTTAGNTNIAIHDLTIKGLGATPPTGVGPADGINMVGVTNLRIYNNSFDKLNNVAIDVTSAGSGGQVASTTHIYENDCTIGVGACIQLGKQGGGTIFDTIVDHNRAASNDSGIALFTSSSTIISDNIIEKKGSLAGQGIEISAVDATGTNNVIVQGNQVYNAPHNGLYVTENGNDRAKNVQFKDNITEGNTEFGIFARGTDVSTVGNTAKYNGKSGIAYYAASSLVIPGGLIENNICSDNGTAGAEQFGILLRAESSGSVQNVQVMGNTCTDDQSTKTQWSGIALENTGNLNSNHNINNNYVTGNASTSVYVAASASAFLMYANTGATTTAGTMALNALTVANSAAFSSGLTVTGNVGITAGDLTLTGANIISNTNNPLYLNTGSSQPIIFRINSSEQARLDTTGNFGLGTTTPGTLLSIGNTGANTINISAAATSTFGSGVNIRTGCYAVNGVCVTGGGTTYTFSYPLLNTANTISEAWGTTTANTWSQPNTFSNGLNVTGNLAVTAGDITLTGANVISNTNNPLYLQTGSSQPILFRINGAEKARLDTTFNFGIGTTTPAQALSVQGNGLISGNLAVAGLTATGTVTFSSLTGTQCLHEVSGVVSGTGSDCGSGGGSFSYPFPLLGLATTSPIMLLASTTIGNGTQANGLTVSGGATTTLNAYFAANVGIASTSPTKALEIAGDEYITGAIGIGVKATGGSDADLSVVRSGTVASISAQSTNTSGVTTIVAKGDVSSAQLEARGSGASNSNLAVIPSSNLLDVTAGTGGLVLLQRQNAPIIFGTGGTAFTNERARILGTGQTGFGSTSPFAKLSIHANPTDTTIFPILFAIGSSTASATTTLFSVDNTGALSQGTSATSTFAGGLAVLAINETGAGTSTFTNGITISSGCFAIGTTCVGTGSGSLAFSYLFPLINGIGTSTGLGLFGSSTIGNGTQNGGLTVSGGATTTGFLTVQSAGTSTFTGGVAANIFNATSATASSTFANGLNITKGCYSINGVCLPSINNSRVKYVVSATSGYGTDTDFQSALDKCATNPGDILLIDPTFTVTAQYKFKGNDCHIDLGDNTLNWNAGSFPTLFSTNSAAAKYQHVGVTHGNITQTNATWQGTVMDASDMSYVQFSDLDILNVMTVYKANDTQNVTFYGTSQNVTVFNTSTSTRAIIINASSTNPWNFNEFDNWRIACDAHCDAVNVVNAKNDYFKQFSIEPSSNVDTNGFWFRSDFNTNDGGILNMIIENPDIEGNAWGIRNSTTTPNTNAPIIGTQVRGGYFGTNAQADHFDGAAKQQVFVGVDFNSVATTNNANLFPTMDIKINGGALRAGMTITDDTVSAQNQDFLNVTAQNGTDGGNGVDVSYAGSGAGMKILASTTAASTTGKWFLQGLSAASASANVLCRITTTGEVVLGTGATTCAPSSIDFKRDVVSSTVGLDALMQLRPVTFFFKENGEPQIGLIAQEVNKIDPRLTDKNTDGSVATINWGDVDAVLIKAVQDQQREMSTLTGKTARSAEENWQWAAIILLTCGLVYQHRRISKLEKR